MTVSVQRFAARLGQMAALGLAVLITVSFLGCIHNGDGNPGITIQSPQDGGIVVGTSVTISVQVSNFEIVDELGQANVPGQGHIHYFMDVAPPTTPGEPAVTAPGTYAATTETSWTWEDVLSGEHNFTAMLVNNDHTPLEPVVYHTITVTVQEPGTEVEIHLSAAGEAFNMTSITVPAGSTVVVHFTNHDFVQHNLAVYTTSAATQSIFIGELIIGVSTTTYTFSAPATPGIYFFRCDTHPLTMTGDFIVT